MANKSTHAKVRHKDGELTVQQQETDSPILPVAQLEQLHHFRPDAVDWVMDQTAREAESRRRENKRVNTLVFVERILGQIFALLIGLGGLIVGGYVAVNGQPVAGGTIASLSLGTLAVAFITGRGKKK